MKYTIVTFGCRVNQADSTGIERQLREAGGRAVAPEDADLVIVNSCSVTATADQGTRQTVRRLARTNPSARVVVTGCYATRAADEVGMLPGVTQIVPNDDKDRLAELLGLTSEPTTAVRFGDGDGACGDRIRPGEGGRTGYTLRVQTGCDERCAYCIIPKTRGPGRSVPLQQVIGNVRRAVGEGFREIAITGVHLGSYGRDLSPSVTLPDLLEGLTALRAPVLFRLSSLEPMDCSPRLVDLVSNSARFAPHFHLPLQHASDRILRAMRRPYTLDVYRALVTDIRRRLPNAAIGSDLIVGFPGETDADVATLLDFLEESPLTYLHVFPYSDRPGTDASRLVHKVPGTVIRDRGRQVRAVGAKLSAQFRRRQVGHVRSALTLDGGARAVTDNYLKVHLDDAVAENLRVQVEITEVGEEVRGRILSCDSPSGG